MKMPSQFIPTRGRTFTVPDHSKGWALVQNGNNKQTYLVSAMELGELLIAGHDLTVLDRYPAEVRA